ncbi:hypothetical protein FRC12_019215 [Ceratobasidium sp. 428]|nr:hypothetical protein FRC12_019215 [Ceratobasidium sp. 428]
MPPKKSQSAQKRRAATPDSVDDEPVGKRTRSGVQNAQTGSPAAPRPRPKPKMRPILPPDSDVEIVTESAQSNASKKPKSGGLKLASVGGRNVSGNSSKGKAKGKVTMQPEDSEYGEDEIDELEDDEDLIAPPKPAQKVKKLKIRVAEDKKAKSLESELSIDEQLDVPEEKLVATTTAKIAFATEKDGILSRPTPIDTNTTYETFMFRVAQAFGAVAGEQELTWKTDRMPKNAAWRELGSEEDFNAILGDGQETLKEEFDKAELIAATNKEGKAKAAKKGKTFVPKKKVPTLTDFVILLRDRNQERKAKEAKSTKKDKKPAKAETAGSLAGVGNKIAEYKEKIEARERCKGCKNNCVLLPANNGQPKHRELSKADIQAWAHSAAKAALKGKAVSFETAPDELMLLWSDRKSEPRGTKAEVTESKSAPTEPVPPLAPPPPPPNAPPYYAPPPAHPQYGHFPAPYPPAYPAYPPNYGYPPPHPGGYGGYGVPPHATGQMLLSEWLVMCDRGQRGEYRDNFAGLIAGFSARHLFYLSDIQNKPTEFFTQIDFPTAPGAPTFRMSLDTASRLCRYLAHDLA